MSKERVSIFIDGSNLYHNLRRYEIRVNFEDLIKKLETKRDVIGIFYYTALLDKKYSEKGYEKHIEFLDKIKQILKFNITLCNLKKIILNDGTIDYQIKGDDVYVKELD